MWGKWTKCTKYAGKKNNPNPEISHSAPHRMYKNVDAESSTWVVDGRGVLRHVTTYLLTHWALVRTHWSLMRVPPQMKWFLTCMPTCQGHSPALESPPPVILLDKGAVPQTGTSTTVQFHQHDFVVWEGTPFSNQKSDFFCYLLYNFV